MQFYPRGGTCACRTLPGKRPVSSAAPGSHPGIPHVRATLATKTLIPCMLELLSHLSVPRLSTAPNSTALANCLPAQMTLFSAAAGQRPNQPPQPSNTQCCSPPPALLPTSLAVSATAAAAKKPVLLRQAGTRRTRPGHHHSLAKTCRQRAAAPLSPPRPKPPRRKCATHAPASAAPTRHQ